MRRNNLWIIGLITAVITVVSLNLIFARSNWANERGFGYSKWRHRHHYCADYYRDNIDRGKRPNRLRPDTANY
ncbi:MAG: hypothetical protein WKG06_05640 [Segetibacter sp.]